MASRRLDQLGGVLRSFLSVWSEASRPGEENRFSGCAGGRLRWGEMFAAPWLKWKVAVYSWLLGECFWIQRRDGGGLEGEIGQSGDFLEKWVQVFAMEGLACGEGDGYGSGALGRWDSGELQGGVWGDSMV